MAEKVSPQDKEWLASAFLTSAAHLFRPWIAYAAFVFVFLWHSLTTIFSKFSNSKIMSRSKNPPAAVSSSRDKKAQNSGDLETADLSSIKRIREAFSERHLKLLINELDEKFEEHQHWEDVIKKSNDNVSYTAKCLDQDHGPTKYLSTTVFENCNTELLRDFYMDNDFRKKWDKTVVEHEQLEVDLEYGIEIGRTIKKFTFLKPREYVLAWRLWEGKGKSYYCLTKACKHPLAAETEKYKRVHFYYSGWQIRKVEGRDACEVKMVHHEDVGLQREMTKLAFSKGTWSYVLKMDANLRKYAQMSAMTISKRPNAVSLLQKVPFEVDSVEEEHSNNNKHIKAGNVGVRRKGKPSLKELFRVHSKKEFLAKGLLLLGGAVCVTRGSSVAAKLAVACLVNKMVKKHDNSKKPC